MALDDQVDQLDSFLIEQELKRRQALAQPLAALQAQYGNQLGQANPADQINQVAQAAPQAPPMPAAPPPQTAPAPTYAPPQSAIDAGLSVLRSKESSGNYSNVTAAGRGRNALGAYGILDENVPEWSKQALGYSITPAQFLRDPKAQDAIARYKFGEYANKYGMAGAARAWLAGEGGMNRNVADRFGSTPTSYAEDFMNKLPAALRGPPPGAIPFSQATPIGAPQLPPQAMAYAAQGAPGPAPAAPPATRSLAPTPPADDGEEVPPGQPKAASPQMAQAAAVEQILSNRPGPSPHLNAEDIGNMYRNPLTRPLAEEYLRKMMDPGTYQYQIVGDNLYRFNSRTGAADVVAKDVRPDQFEIKQVTDPLSGQVKLVRVKKEGPEGPIDYGQGQVDQATSGLTGDAFLQTLDPGRAAQVKALVQGRTPPPTLAALRSPLINGLMRDAAQYDPGFDLTLWKTRNSMLTAATSGKLGQNVASFNTAIYHLDRLDKRIDSLENTGFTPYNAAANAIRRTYDAAFDTNLSKFETDRKAVVDELTRAFRGTGGNVHDIKDWEVKINSAKSPEALHGLVKEAMELLRGRIDAVGEQFNRGMKYTIPVDPTDLLGSKEKAIFIRLGEEGGEPEKAGAAPGQVRITTQAQYDALPKGAHYLDPNGVARTKR